MIRRRTFSLLFVCAVGCGDDPTAGPAVDAAVDSRPGEGGNDGAPLSDASPDGSAGACLGGTTCDVLPNGGCTGDDRCYYAFGTLRTNECASPGTALAGARCAAGNGCVPGLACLGGFCTTLCCPSEPALASCPGRTECMSFEFPVPSGGTDMIGICTCQDNADCPSGSTCNPLLDGEAGRCLLQGTCDRFPQSGCPAGQGCYGSLRECQPAGTALAGDPCPMHGHNECAPGFWCNFFDFPGPNAQCAAYCDPAATPSTCPTGFECRSFDDGDPGVGGCYRM